LNQLEMTQRNTDGSAGDANYGAIGRDYARYRQPEPRIAAMVHAALGASRTVLNVGAGAGSYEPTDREVTAVEPSSAMRAQRPTTLSAAVDAVAEKLPFPDRHFDAAMAIFSVHQWSDLAAGLAEMRRVTRGTVVILTCDPLRVQRFWLDDYAPGVLAAETRRYPALDQIGGLLGGRVEILPIPIPFTCKDGFNEAYYGRPEKLLEDGARLACSAWSFVEPETSHDYVEHLRRDLENGAWDDSRKGLRTQPEFDGSLRLVISTSSPG
jgi:SAM-dependent methyltransferase